MPGFFFVQESGSEWLNIGFMPSLFERYRNANPSHQGGTYVAPSSTPDPSPEVTPPASFVPAYQKPVSDPVRAMINQLLEQEAHIRNQREKFRRDYYRLEREKALQSEFKANYDRIKALTDQLAPIYIKRKKLELTGQIEEVKQLSSQEEIQIQLLKARKRPLIDKRHKLNSKIENHLSYAKGLNRVGQWREELAQVDLSLFEIEKQIESIQEK